MQPAIAQLAGVQRRLLGAFAGKLFDAGQILALLLTLDDSRLKGLGRLRIAVQEIVEFSFQKVEHKTFERRTTGADILRSEFGFGLGLENRLLHFHRHSRRNAAADVLCVVVFSKEVAHHLDVGLAEGSQVCAALRGELTVDEALVVLPVGIGVRDGHFNVLSGQVHNRVAQLAVEAVFEQVFEAIFTSKLLPVEVQGKSRVEVGVVPKQLLYVFREEAVRLENLGIGLEPNARAVALGGGFHLGIVDEFAEFEARTLDLALSHTLHNELGAQGIHRLGADPVESHRLLKCAAVVLAARVDF